jgi:hypothetical protein
MLKRALQLYCLIPIVIPSLLLAQAPPPAAAIARKAVDLLLSEKYADFLAGATADFQKSFPQPELEKLGASIKAYGSVENVGEAAVTKSGPNSIVMIPVKFANQSVNFRVLINATGLVSAFFQLPGAVNWQRPEYSKPDTFKDRAVTLGEGEWKLPGTLTVPAGAGPFPAVVLVHGTGPHDRDETVGGSKVFRDLAEGLASRGIVVLRYEKRSQQYAARMGALAKYTVQEEAVDDAVKAVALVRAQPEVNGQKVYLLGHGLGGYLAPRIAEQDGKLAGLVLLAGNARPLEDVMVEQAEYLWPKGGEQLETVKRLRARVKKLELGDEDSPAPGALPASYWLDLKEYRPADAAKALGLPVLVLQGERDYLTTMTDFGVWKAALNGAKGVVLKSYSALNHQFVAGEGKSLPAEFNKPGHVAPAVIEDIAGFVK